MIEVLFVSIVVLFSFSAKRKNIILLLVFLLPFNDFIKKILVLYGNGGNIFSFWKELAILILFLRSYKYIEKRLLNRPLLIYFCLCIIVGIYYFIGLQYYNASICFRTVRNILILPLLFVSLNGLAVNISLIRKVVLLFSISTLLISLIGIWEIHMGGRIPLRLFMGNITDNNTYSAPNFTMMGIDRMCSIMTVPNSFGYLMAFHASFLLYIFLYMKDLFSKIEIYILYTLFLVTVFCLLESFCRTGWFLFVFSYFISLYYINRKVFISRIIIFIIIGLCILSIAYVLSPDIETIVNSTFSGNEVSASDRSNNLSNGFSFIFENPFGHGLGSSDNSTDNYVYFAESTFVNLSVEIGIIGSVFYIFSLFFFLSMMRKTDSAFTPFSVAIMSANMISIIPTNVYVTPYSYFVFIFSGLALMKDHCLEVKLKK